VYFLKKPLVLQKRAIRLTTSFFAPAGLILQSIDFLSPPESIHISRLRSSRQPTGFLHTITFHQLLRLRAIALALRLLRLRAIALALRDSSIKTQPHSRLMMKTRGKSMMH